MTPEPTIPGAVVDAAAKALHEIDCQAPKPCGWLVQNDMPSITQGHYDLFRRRARGALAAAEPLMHERCRRELDEESMERSDAFRELERLRGQNARLTDDLTSERVCVRRLERTVEALEATHARLREALETVIRDWVDCRDIGMDRWGNFVRCGKCAPCKAATDAGAALAPSDEMPGYDCDAYQRSGACGCSTGVLGAAPCPHVAPGTPSAEETPRPAP